MGLIEQSSSFGKMGEGFERATGTKLERPIVSILFAVRNRPTAEQVDRIPDRGSSFVVSFDPAREAARGEPGENKTVEKECWVELASNGLSFDLQGLAPGRSQPVPSGIHRYGLQTVFDVPDLEAISVRPGPGIGGGKRAMPVLRSLALIAAELSALPGARAVGWHAARAWSAPEHFRGSVLRWIEGGAFPGLGLTALAPTSEGGLVSEGMALFTGQELRLDPEMTRDRREGARLALRLLHWLVERGGLDAPERLSGPTGEVLILKPSLNKRYVGVSRA